MQSEWTDRQLLTVARELEVLCRSRSWVLATAESCTGGWVGKVLTDLPGSSDWFGFGFITYANAAKQQLLGVPEELLARTGAVSEPVARAMADGARAVAGADAAIAITGVAGPGGGSVGKPVGTVCFGWALPGRVETQRHWFSGNREAVRRQSVAHALGKLVTLASTVRE